MWLWVMRQTDLWTRNEVSLARERITLLKPNMGSTFAGEAAAQAWLLAFTR